MYTHITAFKMINYITEVYKSRFTWFAAFIKSLLNYFMPREKLIQTAYIRLPFTEYGISVGLLWCTSKYIEGVS